MDTGDLMVAGVLGHQRTVNRWCPKTDLFLEMAELPATGSLGTGQLDTRDLLVAGVLISISSKYLYLYLELSGSTPSEEAASRP